MDLEHPGAGSFKRIDAFALTAILAISIILAALLTYATAYKGPQVTTVPSAPAFSGAVAKVGYPTKMMVTIPHADRFTPFVAQVAAGGTVTWQNQDSDAHTVVAMPSDPIDFKLTVAPGATGSFTFTQPGVYGYYCDVHSMYDPATGLVKADKGADAYPVSMYGIILVVGSTLPVASGRDKVVVPGADRFMPLATVVHTGTTVTWTNIDSDAHSVYSTPGDVQQLKLTVNPDGASSDYTFQKAGTYTYYCNLHAKWNTDVQRAEALPGSSEYPAAMEGVVFVLP